MENIETGDEKKISSQAGQDSPKARAWLILRQ